MASEHPEQAEECAKLCCDMDDINKVAYNSHILNPYEHFFTGNDIDQMRKIAEEHVVVVETPIPIDEFVKLATEKLPIDFRKADQGVLGPIVKAAKQDGGIMTSGRLSELDEDLQSRFLASLADLHKHAASLAPQTSLNPGGTTPLSGATQQQVSPTPTPAQAPGITPPNPLAKPTGLGAQSAPAGAASLALHQQAQTTPQVQPTATVPPVQ
ncbi:MAG: hypothetical protein EB168_11715 [Euryarchaeota archaeon]|nr:hypothetical protein [Euryarchaeota archaeon]